MRLFNKKGNPLNKNVIKNIKDAVGRNPDDSKSMESLNADVVDAHEKNDVISLIKKLEEKRPVIRLKAANELMNLYNQGRSGVIINELRKLPDIQLINLGNLLNMSGEKNLSEEVSKLIKEKKDSGKYVSYGNQTGHPEEPKSARIDPATKESYGRSKETHLEYENLLKKAYNQNIAKTDVDLMVYFLAKYNDLNEKWDLIAKAKTSREIKGIWTGRSFGEVLREVLNGKAKHKHGAEKERIYLTHDFLRSKYHPLEKENKILFLVKNIALKFDWTEKYKIDIIVNEKINFEHISKIYVFMSSTQIIEELKKIKQKYPFIEVIYYSRSCFYEILENLFSYSGANKEIGYSTSREGLVKTLISEKQNTLNKLIRLRKEGKKLPKEQANAYRLYLEGIDTDIDFLIKLEKNIKLFQNFYSDNKDSFDKLKLVENKLEGTNITFKEFRKQWDDEFPHLEKYDYYKNVTYRGGYSSNLSRQIEQEIERVDSGEYDNEAFNLDRTIELKEEYLDSAKKTRKIYTDKKRNKWLFKTINKEYKYMAYAEVCAYEFAKLINPDTVEVKYFEHDAKLGTLQKIIPGAVKLTNIKIEDLTKQQLRQMQSYSIIDWLIANRDAHGNNFLVKNKTIYAIDKGLAFCFLEDENLDSNNPFDYCIYYGRIYDSYINGKIDLQWEDIEPFIKKAESISDAKYINIFRPYIEERFKGASEEKTKFIKLMLERKKNIRKDFEKLYENLREKRAEQSKPKLGREYAELMEYAKQSVSNIINNSIKYTDCDKYLHSTKLITDGYGNKKTEAQIYEEEFRNALAKSILLQYKKIGDEIGWINIDKFLHYLQNDYELMNFIADNLFEKEIKNKEIKSDLLLKSMGLNRKKHELNYMLEAQIKDIRKHIITNKYPIDDSLLKRKDIKGIFTKYFYKIQYSSKDRLWTSDDIIIDYFEKIKTGIFMDIGIAAGMPQSGKEEDIALATRWLAKKMSEKHLKVDIIGIDITTDGLGIVLEDIRNKKRKDSEIPFIAPNLKYKRQDATKTLFIKEYGIDKSSVDIIREAYVFTHLNKDEIKEILKNVMITLKEGGLFISVGNPRKFSFPTTIVMINEIYKKKNRKLEYLKTIAIDLERRQKEYYDTCCLKKIIREIEEESAPSKTKQTEKEIITLLEEKKYSEASDLNEQLPESEFKDSVRRMLQGEIREEREESELDALLKESGTAMDETEKNIRSYLINE
ncbi:MAG: hypothetical protein DRN66_01250 [Candidatus Nanohalarchaeota archaeon]|nr:MAG: hypothetical protein DRN66_01250 [Candidatus Nanohaloarchaeota archaeon]